MFLSKTRKKSREHIQCMQFGTFYETLEEYLKGTITKSAANNRKKTG